MAIRVALNHKTSYHYDRLINLGPQVVRLRPAPHCRTPISSYSLNIAPKPHFINWQQDPHGNYLARIVFPEKTEEFSVEVDLVAEISSINPFDFFLEPDAENFPFSYTPDLAEDLRPYLRPEETGPLVKEFVASVDRTPLRTNDFLVAINQRLEKEIDYVIRMEPGVQSPDETLKRGSGSCRDTGWLLVQILRGLGLAARFVSGYLIQLKPDVKPLDGPSGADSDFTDLHAWTEVFLPGAGWVGLDPTSGLLAAEGHLPVAATPHYKFAAPVEGALDPAEVEFEHAMSVRRIFEAPRVTKPYSETQWESILSLGDQVDRDLDADGVGLTMGGEPTFVSIDDMESAEWDTDAVGPNKRRLAEDLIRRLRRQFAPGGFLHYGQGKWYPGEQLPRWALSCYWRQDGHPIWEDASLVADPWTTYNFTAADAHRFAETLAQRLEVDGNNLHVAYEDPLHFLQKEGDVAVNLDPADNHFEDPMERDRIRRVFRRGLGEPVGYVLPVQRIWLADERIWQSGLWMLRAPHKVFLAPGDSPIGLRLPLQALPWVDDRHLQIHPPDPQIDWGPLHQPERQRNETDEQRAERLAAAHDRRERIGQTSAWRIRTALCIEAREGRLHVFVPPLDTTDDYLDLLAAIEDTAANLSMPVAVEGYTPPFDPRINHIKVTPDPGVIEVNIHPAHNWRELVHNTTTLYEEARQARLGTEKFMTDGRHSGTGGGNHVVLGGKTPGESPILRRPDVLRSMVSYWLNHPSLSYIFSGLFIGPTSQSPRVDETRADAVYELEIALKQIDQAVQGWCPGWLVDRVFRHLLVDVTGNTHRAEFCIDKLYAPESATGRLGLLELRALEMPPHARMSLTQQLLIRALLARFWRRPYKAAPVHWGTRLHDEYMLPHYLESDFADVLDDLRDSGYEFSPDWFAPHVEFRFPSFGSVQYRGIGLEIRQAGEPWYVLGEEPGATGTARYVDSSVERVQVKVSGLVDSRFVVCCNGRRVPLRSTGIHGEFVGAVRFRAWQPPSCLHPTIPVHEPLVFDIVDGWSERSIGGCTYHVGHPGGLNPSAFPVNAYEAEGRRSARFEPMGHTPGPMQPPVEAPNPQFPLTLDLRRF